MDADRTKDVADFIGEGIERGDLCFIMATSRHLKRLNKILRGKGINVRAATEDEQYFTFDAKWIISMTPFENGFDPATYRQTIKKISLLAARAGQHVRAFGEIPA